MNDRIKEFLNEELNLLNNLNEEEILNFYGIIDNYLKRIRLLEETFYYNITTLKAYLEEEGLTEEEIIRAIANNPSYIHADKSELSLTFSIISVIQNSKTKEYVKKDIIINHGEFLRTEANVIYARIKHIMNLIDNNSKILRNNFITVRKVLKVTNQEFEGTYKMSKEQLLRTYPIDMNSMKEIASWNEQYHKELANKEIVGGGGHKCCEINKMTF